MGLPEDDREYYREQAGIERCRRTGKLIECYHCDRISEPYFTSWDDDRNFPMCQRCRDRREEEAEGEEEARDYAQKLLDEEGRG